MNDVELALSVAYKMLGEPYVWAGDDPMAGFDCSGLLVEILKSAGRLPPVGDWTADDLMRMFRTSGDKLPGVLVFWGSRAKATHIEMIYDVLDSGRILTIGASGGTSKVKDVRDAILQNAYVKIRPIRINYIALRDPFADLREEES